jgi:DNA repair exonuclease SbcCD ATPase subunit
MKIRALVLENVRKFGGKRVSIDDIGDGITVICEANEFGKSTFFDAIHAAFFEKHTATGKNIQSLRPHAGGGVRIGVEVEVDGGRYAIEKRFLAQKSATVTDLARGTVIARDGEAEDWMARNIGTSDNGPAGLLWVRQGVLGLEPADGSKTQRERLTEARRDLLSSVAGEIEQVTGGRTMDRILRRCQEDLASLATDGRHQPRGAWKEAVDSVKVLSTELEQLERQCAELSEALGERRAIEAELRRLDDPAEKSRREEDVKDARAAAREAETFAQKIAAAETDLLLAAARHADAERLHGNFAEAITAAETASRMVTEAEALRDTAVENLNGLRMSESDLRAALIEAETATKALRTELAAAERASRVDRARDDAKRLDETLQQVRTHIEAAAECRARIANNPVTAKALTAAEAAVSEASRLRAAVAASTARLTIDYSGETRLILDGASLPGGEGIPLKNGAEIEMPGIGSLRFSLPEDAAHEDVGVQLQRAHAAETDALAFCGAQTLAEARQRAQQRQSDENAVKLAEQMIRSLAPSGVEALEQALADARETVKGAPEGPARSSTEIASDLEAAETREAELRGRLHAASEKVAEAREKLGSAETALTAARDTRDQAQALAGEESTRESRLADLLAVKAKAEADVLERQNALDELKADAPDVATAAANVGRAEAAFENARKRRERLVERRADLSARIDTRAEEGVEERRDEVAGRLESARRRASRYEEEVAALVRLMNTLEAAREGAREAYFEPVQEELRPLLRILHDDAGIDWATDSITPGALRRGGEVEAFETLSGGTQEQIAILTRLAFARLFARRGQHLPIILDDALVYSDDDRIVKMFTALNRVAMQQQIIVFSCRQLAFAGLGGDRPDIQVRDVA